MSNQTRQQRLVSNCQSLFFVSPEITQCLFCDSAVAQLYNAIIEQASTANRAYHSVQLWRQLAWQPIFLVVNCVYVLNAIPQLTSLQQRQLGSSVYGLALPELQPVTTDALIEGCTQLRQVFTQIERLVNCHTRLGRTQWQGLSADLLAKALLSCGAIKPPTNLSDLLVKWQQLLFHKQLSHYQIDPDGIKVKLSTCCQHLQIEPNNPCLHCPKSTKRNLQRCSLID